MTEERDKTPASAAPPGTSAERVVFPAPEAPVRKVKDQLRAEKSRRAGLRRPAPKRIPTFSNRSIALDRAPHSALPASRIFAAARTAQVLRHERITAACLRYRLRLHRIGASACIGIMILACPECRTRYQTDALNFPPAGRKVRCAKCGHIWHQQAPHGGGLAPGQETSASARLLLVP